MSFWKHNIWDTFPVLKLQAWKCPCSCSLNQFLHRLLTYEWLQRSSSVVAGGDICSSWPIHTVQSLGRDERICAEWFIFHFCAVFLFLFSSIILKKCSLLNYQPIPSPQTFTVRVWLFVSRHRLIVWRSRCTPAFVLSEDKVCLLPHWLTEKTQNRVQLVYVKYLTMNKWIESNHLFTMFEKHHKKFNVSDVIVFMSHTYWTVGWFLRTYGHPSP